MDAVISHILSKQTKYIAIFVFKINLSVKKENTSTSELYKSFLPENFLLSTPFAEKLYHTFAKDLPIIDYHCHLPSKEIADDRQFENLTQVWLAGDHYKWRAMRTMGIDERYITGSAPDKEKFNKWAYTVPFAVRNPLYHWSHLELKRYFGSQKLINPTSADEIYDLCTAQLDTKEFSARGLLKKMNVEVVCTTDDPVDTLEHHEKLSKDHFEIKILAAFRPDKAYTIEDQSAYAAYLEKLSQTSGIEINGFAALTEALTKRIEYFHAKGCRLSDHGLEQLYFLQDATLDAERIFTKIRKQEQIRPEEQAYFKYCVLKELCKVYHKKNWVQQFHLGALRSVNTRMINSLGADTGFDSIGGFSQAQNMARFLNELDSTNQLAKTILYNLNPADNEIFASMIGNFNDGSVRGKMQFGAAWWFLDQKDGIEKQLNALSNLGLLSCFIGMLTDSRSFLSYPRHEYFRRILCNLIGTDVAKGELPADEKWLGKIVSDICYHNARAYFKF